MTALGIFSDFPRLTRIRFNVTAVPANDDTTNYPPGRGSACVGVSTAPDDSTFQITVYGGFSLLLGWPLNDVYMLSIPSFQWFNVTPEAQDLGDSVHGGRAFSRCHTWNDGQMIVLGGQTQTFGRPVWETACDPQHPPLLVFDTSKLEWSDTFDPSLTYTVPDIIKSKDSASASPDGGWQDDDLSSIFAQRVPATPLPSIRAAGVAQTSGSPSPGVPTETPEPPKSHAGVIAGGVVGGVAGLGLIAGALYYFLRRQKRYQGVARSEAAAANADTEYKGHDLGPVQEADGRAVVAEADANHFIREAPGSEGVRHADGTYYKPDNAARNSGVYEMQGD
jgi:hypothetical protein